MAKVKKEETAKPADIEVKPAVAEKTIELKPVESPVITPNAQKDVQPMEKSYEEKMEKRDDRPGIAYIYTTSNNTIIHITDLAGNTLSRVSGGMITKQSRLKSSPTIAMFVSKRAAERARDLGITSLYIRMRGRTGDIGLGPGGHAAVKSLSKEGFRIINVLDATKVPRGGPKKKGGKRGRRV